MCILLRHPLSSPLTPTKLSTILSVDSVPMMGSTVVWSSVMQRVTSFTNTSLTFFRFHHKTTLALSSFAVTTFLLYPWANQNYHEYLALGPGGVPYNILGWAFVTALKPIEGETLSTGMYDRDSDKSGWLCKGDGEGEIPLRKGTKPKTGWHCIPHRQLDQIPGDDVKEVSTCLLIRGS